MNRSITKLIVVLLASIFIVDTGFAKSIGVAKAQTQQAQDYNIIKQSSAEIQRQSQVDKFTQTEAHLQNYGVRKLLSAEDSKRYIPYMNILADCLTKEVENKATHRVFYHTTDNEWRVAQDLYTQLNALFNPSGKSQPKDFAFLRFTDINGPKARDFLQTELTKSGLIDDNGEVRALLLSVNLSLFGNADFPSECTWDYFLQERAQKHVEPDTKVYKEMLDKFGLTDQYIPEIMSLIKLLNTKEKTLIQIFVPKDKVDDIGYLAWATGIPAHKEIVNWVRSNVTQKVYKGKVDPATGQYRAGALWAMWDLADTFKKEREKNPMFKSMMDGLQEGDYSLESYLKLYCNSPWNLEGINYAQARLIFSPEVLLNPMSGVKIYRHTALTKEQNSEYSKQLNQIIDKIAASRKGAK